ncbi:hypothetical protein NPIL_686561 [Nephila pilipes]|uniref:Uncharacterized protein n=1 Tax=Nephila pilipes TaxID=299642 RepID=A0A8X6ML99_NEPPI|nr:hypothetical protein NPIL_686561 [Nephila pilipes]
MTSGLSFQQDNAWPHTVYLSTVCLHTSPTLSWLESSDHSPIDHVYVLMNWNPLLSLDLSCPTSQLECVLRPIVLEDTRQLYKSMPNRTTT